MSEVFKIIGLVACGLVFARHMCRAFTGRTLGELLTEGVKSMLNMTDQQLSNCIHWNIGKRDRYLARSERAQNPLTRAEALRQARHHQRNIEQLNSERRQLDRSN